MKQFYSRINTKFTGDRIFSVPSDYLKKDNIKVFVNDVEISNWSFLNDTQITISPDVSLTTGDIISCRRYTEINEKAVTYKNMSMLLDEGNLNLSQDQLIYAIQELYDSNEQFVVDITKMVEDNAKIFIDRIQTLQNTIDSTTETITNAVNKIDTTIANVQGAVQITAENAQIAIDQAEIATEKANIVQNLYDTAVSNINTAKTESLSAIEEKKTASVAEITDIGNETTSDITTTKEAAINAVNTAKNEAVSAKEDIISTKNTIVADIASLKTETLSDIDASKTASIAAINGTKDTAIANIDETLDAAKTEILNAKTEVLDDLITNAASDALGRIEEIETNTTNNINTTATNAVNTINTNIEAAKGIVETMVSDVGNIVSTIVDDAKTELDTVINTADTDLTNKINTANTDFTNSISNAKSEISTAITNAKTDIDTAVNSAEENIQTVSSEAVADITSIKETATSTLNTTVETATKNITDTKDDAVETITNKVTAAETSIDNKASTAQTNLENAATTAQNNLNAAVNLANTMINNKVTTVTNIETHVEQLEASTEANSELARKYAENPVDTPVIEGEYSAKHWAQKAADSADSVMNPVNQSLSNINEAGEQKIKDVASTIIPDIDEDKIKGIIYSVPEPAETSDDATPSTEVYPCSMQETTAASSTGQVLKVSPSTVFKNQISVLISKNIKHLNNAGAVASSFEGDAETRGDTIECLISRMSGTTFSKVYLVAKAILDNPSTYLQWEVQICIKYDAGKDTYEGELVCIYNTESSIPPLPSTFTIGGVQLKDIPNYVLIKYSDKKYPNLISFTANTMMNASSANYYVPIAKVSSISIPEDQSSSETASLSCEMYSMNYDWFGLAPSQPCTIQSIDNGNPAYTDWITGWDESFPTRLLLLNSVVTYTDFLNVSHKSVESTATLGGAFIFNRGSSNKVVQIIGKAGSDNSDTSADDVEYNQECLDFLTFLLSDNSYKKYWRVFGGTYSKDGSLYSRLMFVKYTNYEQWPPSSSDPEYAVMANHPDSVLYINTSEETLTPKKMINGQPIFSETDYFVPYFEITEFNSKYPTLTALPFNEQWFRHASEQLQPLLRNNLSNLNEKGKEEIKAIIKELSIPPKINYAAQETHSTTNTNEIVFTCPKDGVIWPRLYGYNKQWAYVHINNKNVSQVTTASTGYVATITGEYTVKKGDVVSGRSSYYNAATGSVVVFAPYIET